MRLCISVFKKERTKSIACASNRHYVRLMEIGLFLNEKKELISEQVKLVRLNKGGMLLDSGNLNTPPNL